MAICDSNQLERAFQVLNRVMRRTLTYRWQRSMRPDNPTQRWRVIVWLVLLSTMVGWWCFSWIENAVVTRWTINIQLALGWTDGEPKWWQHGDGPLHVVTAFIVVLLLHAGRNLLCPMWPWWYSFAMTIAIALADESMQWFSTERRFEFHDLMCDAIGLACAWLLLWKLAALSPLVDVSDKSSKELHRED
jgi:hypothetical protein